MSEKYIEIVGAKAHNLKNISLNIPRDKFVVVTGLSGSGKSSLAFDTIYAEGQRRYMDTLSTYAKHFIGALEKPEVESIEGLSPIIAIEQKTTGSNPRSTVGTITEIYDFLRLLYARGSTAYSPATGKEMIRYTDSQIVELIVERYAGRKCYLLAPLVVGRKGHYKELFASLRRRGYSEVRIDGEIRNLAELEQVDRYKVHFIELVVDRLKPSTASIDEDPEAAAAQDKRLRKSVETALNFGKGSLAILDAETLSVQHYSRNLICPETGISLPSPEPHSFSFNSPEGYCPHCKGLGTIVDVNIDTIIPDKEVSLAEGGIVPLGALRDNRKFDIIRSIARKYGFSIYDRISAIPEDALTLIIYGSDEIFRIGEGNMSEMTAFDGIVEDIEDKVVCPVCRGTRLNKNAEYFKIDGLTISEVAAMEIGQLLPWLEALPGKFSVRQKSIASDILKELRERAQFLLDLGLDYLSLDRPTASLSGGESQRIRLATSIGSKLVNVLYILDEPSIGLHQRDNRKLIGSLKTLRDEGNTVMVVEHDAETMLSADWLVDIGPGAGVRGGHVCYNGPADSESIKASAANSTTLQYLCGEKKLETPLLRRPGNGKTLSLRGCTGNNLKDVDIDFPLGCIIGISGVSGSGKSSLIDETLVPYIKNKLYRSKQKALPLGSVEGLKNIDKLIEIDQSPIGKTPRSNPATFTGVFDDIRNLFAQTPDAKVRGFRPSRFSFNVSGGRCEMCKGAGIKLIEMNFLPSVNVVCEECLGKRYKSDTLAVRYKGKNISEVLEMPISEAYEFFKSVPKIADRLKALVEVGLGYVQLGQAATTLSGGESQRMKLAAELGRKGTGRTLYVMDEPTTGLHFEDIKVLLGVMNALVDEGNTIIVIEHNLDILKSVDYLFDLGPEGGRRGGLIISQGTPEQVAADPQSVTGPFLQASLRT